ncbi:MAG: 16S rRNA methyltransferase [Thermoplasmata archaeon]|nr:16S rRNA methyltransferase [Thermoplasmata archaeon]
MLIMILADAELELVPGEFWDNQSVIRNAKRRKKKPSKMLLDSSLHRSVFKDETEAQRRGRPDIVYSFLSLCIDSIANAEGKLMTLVHTRNDELIEFSPDTRLPKSYNRFVGLMEDLFDKGAVPERKPLVTMTKDMSLERVLGKCEAETAICLSPDGEPVDLIPLFRGVNKPVVCIIGGFPEGDYTSPAVELADRVVSISPHLLKPWTVASNILVGYQESEKTY